MAYSSTAVLLMAYGAAATPEDVPAYLADIRGGRPATPELIADVRRRYEEMGGKSPLLTITRKQAAALEKSLNKGISAKPYKVFVGMRHSPPTIEETIKEIAAGKFARLIGVPLTPYYSAMSVGAYQKKFEDSVAAQKLPAKVQFIHSWSDKPGFIETWANRIASAIDELPVKYQSDVEIIFSAHSLPKRILENNDPYPLKLQQASKAIAEKAKIQNWVFAYQSKGQTAEPWLGPDVSEVIDELGRRKKRGVIVAPIGFVSDHMETLYDIDVLYRKQAQARGLVFKRVRSLNEDPSFIETLAGVIREKIA